MLDKAARQGADSADVFVGRERELAVLDAALAAARDQRGRIVLFTGEPGIGKTRLIEEFARTARSSGATVVIGRCYEGEGAPPFWPWVQVLRAVVEGWTGDQLREQLGLGVSDLAQLVPELRARVPELVASPVRDPEEGRFRLFDAVATLLRRVTEAALLVVVLDDLQGADTPSLRLLEFVARSVSDLRLVIIGTCRDEALQRGDALATSVGELMRGTGRKLHTLTGFDATTLARYFASATGVAPSAALLAAVQRRTDGNPLYVTEMVRLLSSEGDLASVDAATVERLGLPPGVQAVISRRVSERSRGCAELLELATLYGREFRADALRQIAGLGDDAMAALLEEALDANLVHHVPGSGRYRFAHALTRDALYGALSAPRRAALHRRAGEALEAVSASESVRPFAELAAQFHAAGDPRAIGYARAAGDRALALLAHEEAARQYADALSMVERAPHPDEPLRCELLLALGDAQRRANELEVSRATILLAADSARRRGAREQLARAALTFGADLGWGDAGTVDSVRVALLEEALVACEGDDTDLHVRLLGRLAMALVFDAATAPRRMALTDDALARARRLDDPRVIAFALYARHLAVWSPSNTAERLVLADELVALAELHHERALLLEGHTLRLNDLLDLDDVSGFDAGLATVTRLAAEVREGVHYTLVDAYRATRLTMQGRFAEAEALAAEVAVNEQRIWPGRPPVVCGAMMYAVARLRGALGAMIDALQEAAATHSGIPAFRFILAYAYTMAGREAEARYAFERIAEHEFADVPRDLNFLTTTSLASEVCTFVGDRRRAEILYDLLRPHASSNVTFGGPMEYGGAVSHYLGKLAGFLGRRDEAERYFVDALAREQTAGAAPWAATTQYEYAAMLLARADGGDRKRAAELLEAALATAGALEMRGLQTQILATRKAEDDRPRSAALPPADVFRREGEYWTLAYVGTAIRMRDTKGLLYIARLLAEPGRDIHVLDLVIGGGARDNESDARIVERDAGTVLDQRATGEYKRRLAELRDELADAAAANDIGRAERARHEIETITQALGAAYGLHGRPRTLGDPAERARKAVTNQIRRAIERIGRQHAALGRHLENGLRTGFVCTYRPEQPVAWKL